MLQLGKHCGGTNCLLLLGGKLALQLSLSSTLCCVNSGRSARQPEAFHDYPMIGEKDNPFKAALFSPFQLSVGEAKALTGVRNKEDTGCGRERIVTDARPQTRLISQWRR